MRKRNLVLGFVALAGYLMVSAASAPAISPMSKVMQKMQGFMTAEKQNIKDGKDKAPYPDFFQKIKTARITKGKKRDPQHELFIDSLIQHLDAYYWVADPERKDAFNRMVGSCITCHNHECPGPVMVIEKNNIR